MDIIDRLEKYGLLTKKSILAHGVHLSSGQIRKINEHGSRMVHNARSNMNNAVGYAPVNLFGPSTALGTDGFPSDMFEEAKFAYFRNADSNARLAFSRIPEMLQAGNALASTIFGKKFGALEKGNAADLVVLDYVPPTPITKENLAAHFLFGMSSSMVESVMIGGKWVVRHRELVGINVPTVYKKTGAAAKKLWSKIQKRS
jgi:cytosine/adenosine deaminase-related metal-dependent hydrolase